MVVKNISNRPNSYVITSDGKPRRTRPGSGVAPAFSAPIETLLDVHSSPWPEYHLHSVLCIRFKQYDVLLVDTNQEIE